MADKGDVGYKLKLGTKEAIEGLKVLDKNLDKVGNKVGNIGKQIKKAFNNTAIIGFVKGLKSLTEMMMKASEAEAEYVESMNLLAVSYRADTEEGEKLYDQTNELLGKMKEILGLDPASLTQQVGIYKQMTSAMGMTNEQSALLSQNLIKLQQDTASLYNLQSSEVATKFQSALAGQTRAVRSLGVDITQASLQQELYNLGINKSITSLNRASKSVLIYLAMERQLANANGDASRTINSMANQMKIFKEQVAIAGRQLGAVFIPILKTILPIANAILMVFNDIMEIILGLFGVDVQTMAKEFGQKSVDIADGFGDVASGADKATKATKKLLGLRGFDKLNNITTPQDSGKSSSGGGVGGGVGIGKVDSKLLDALDEYNLHLEETKNKAREIANWIEKWLIYTDEDGQKHLTTLGKVVTILGVGGLVAKGVQFIYDTVKAISGIFGKNGLLGSLTGASESAGLLGLSFGEWALVIGSAVAQTWNLFDVIKKIKDKMDKGMSFRKALQIDGIGDAIQKVFAKSTFDTVFGVWGELGLTILSVKGDIEDASKALDDFLDKNPDVKNFANDIKDAFGKAWKWVEDNVIKPIKDVYKMFDEATKAIRDFIWETIKIIADFIGQKATFIIEIAQNILGIISGISETIWILIKAGIEFIWNKVIKPFIDWIEDKFHIFERLKIAFELIKTIAVGVITYIFNKVKEQWENFKKLLSKGGDFVKGITDGIGNILKKAINFVIDGINNLFNKVFGKLNDFLRYLKNWEILGKKPFENKVNEITIPQIKKFELKAEGGFVDEGEMFIAREAGPEMVGTINNKTAVANNDQIVKGITEGVMIGVAKAMSNSKDNTVVIEATGDTEGLINFITFKQKERDRQFGL